MRQPAVVAFAIAIAIGVLSAQSTIPAGTYKGTWTGAQAGGDIHLTLRDGKAEVGFTLEGQEIPGKVLSLKIDGPSITLVYEFDLQGNKLQSSTEGTLKGTTLEGTYKTTAVGEDAPLDQGTWKTVAQ
jgi:hypothetical protein